METSTKTALTVCGLCGGGCFVDVRLDGGKVQSVSKAQGHPGIQGGLCVRGAALKTYLDHPQRLRQPLRRVGEKGSGDFEPISWEEAFALLGERLRRVKTESGAEATVFYSGHPKWYRYAMAELAREYGTPNYCTESSTCHSSPWIAYRLCYGCAVKPPDLKNCRTLLCWASNPAYSQRNAPAVFAVRERGGNLIVVDPRKTPVGERATLHLAPRPGTDGALALAMANVILSEGLEDKAFLDAYAHGLEEYRAYAARFTPETAAGICGVPAGDIVRAARMIALEGPMALYTSSCGMAHSPGSVQSERAVFLLEALTGNFDRPGGNHGPEGKTVRLNGFQHAAKPRVRVEREFTQNRYPVWNELIDNEGQAMGLDEAIFRGEPYPIRNVIAFGMNHRMFPDPERMRRALAACEFYVDVDMFMTDSAKWADLVLPCQMAPEREEVHLLGGKRVFYRPKALPSGDCLNDVEILLGICRELDLHGPVTGMRRFEEYMDWMLSPTGVSLEELKKAPEGLPLRRWREAELHSYRRGLDTPTGKVEFVSEVMRRYAGREGYDALPVYREYWEKNPDPAAYPMVLCIGPRKPWLFHSRTYRLPWLAGLEAHPLLSISPADAQALGTEEGERLTVVTPYGRMGFAVEVTPNVQPGMAVLFHDDEQSDANELVDPAYQDPISGFPGFRSYFCRLEKEGEA